MKYSMRRRHIRNKSKRLLAAVAGAAVMSSAMLPGLPITKVFAAPNNTNQGPIKNEWSNTYKLDPVKTVRDNAYTYGFDPRRDNFTILDQSATKATVEVKASGQTF